MSNAIKVSDLSKDYGSFKLDHVNITLPTGYIMGVIGENGAGKTTLIKAILGLVKSDEGTIEILGEPFDLKNKMLKEHIGVVMDTCSFPEDMTISNIDRVMSHCYTNWNKDVFYQYIRQFQLPTEKKVKHYSKGMKMKLSIATALSHDSKLLILDEATAGLDPVVRNEMLDILYHFIQDESHSVFLSSHILSDLEKICDYITLIHDGKVVFSESKEQLMEKYGIVKCTEEAFQAVDQSAVVACRKNCFGIEALVEKGKVNSAFIMDHATIEDIMVYFIKEGKE